MAILEISVDESGINEIAGNIINARRQLIGKLAERGRQHLWNEVPKKTGNLQQGIAAPDVSLQGVKTKNSANKLGKTTVDYKNYKAELIVSARSARRASLTGQIFEKGKATGQMVRLKPQPAYNYAAAVAKGRPEIRPKGKALLIPFDGTPRGRYVRIGGQNYIYAGKAKAMKANPFDKRAAKLLERDASQIAEEVLSKFI